MNTDNKSYSLGFQYEDSGIHPLSFVHENLVGGPHIAYRFDELEVQKGGLMGCRRAIGGKGRSSVALHLVYMG